MRERKGQSRKIDFTEVSFGFYSDSSVLTVTQWFLINTFLDMKPIRKCKWEKVPFKSKALNVQCQGGLSKVTYSTKWSFEFFSHKFLSNFFQIGTLDWFIGPGTAEKSCIATNLMMGAIKTDYSVVYLRSVFVGF